MILNTSVLRQPYKHTEVLELVSEYVFKACVYTIPLCHVLNILFYFASIIYFVVSYRPYFEGKLKGPGFLKSCDVITKDSYSCRKPSEKFSKSLRYIILNECSNFIRLITTEKLVILVPREAARGKNKSTSKPANTPVAPNLETSRKKATCHV